MSSDTDRSSSSSPILHVTPDDIMEEAAMSNMELSHDKMETSSGESSSQNPKQMSMDSVPGTSSGTVSDSSPGIDQLLQRHRNEIMYELRRLQLGDRPVTGQGHKEAVENFFIRAQGGDDVEDSEHRPESVTVEVNSLVERRPVSSMLQSAGFRRNLETALRGAIGSLSSRRTPPVQSRTNRNNNVQSSTNGGAPIPPPLPSNDSQPTPSAEPVPSPPSLNLPSIRQPSTSQTSRGHESTATQHNSYSSTRSRVQPHVAQSRPVIPSRPHVTRAEPEVLQPPSRYDLAQQWLLQQVPIQNDPSVQRQLTAMDLLEQSQREEFIADISELVQRQLVTSSLESNFRGNLENLMMSRLDTTGSDGQRVQEFIQSLPPRPTARNDFSHLGINMQALSDNLDDVSVISATAAVTVPYAQSGAAMSREMTAIKAQLTQLRNMMQTSFDMQLDIQRAIRQEVSAAVSAAMTDARPDACTASIPQPATRPVSDSHCLICLDKSVDSVLYQCGHMCVCYKCGMDLKSRGNHCPVCRAPIRDIIRAYRSNVD